MDINRRRGLCSTYMQVKILLLVATVGKARITSEEICVLCKDFTAIILHGLALLITFICSYFIFDISLEIYFLNTLKGSGICFRYLFQLCVQQLNRFPFPELPHWIQFLKEISYVITMATSVNVLLNYISVQNESFENHIQRFVILAVIIVLTIYLEFIGQYKSTLRGLFAAIISLTICTGVSVSFTRLFWSSLFCSIFIAVHISVNQFKDYVLCCANKEIADAPRHIVENELKNTIKRSLNKENEDASSHKEGMVNKLLECANVSNVNEKEYHIDKESFKRKLNLFETGHKSVKKVISGPTTKKLKTKSLRLNNNEIYFERMCCKQKQPSKNLGFPFGHCVHSKLNLTFGIGSIDSNADEDLNKQVEQITNWVLKPVDVIEKPDFQRELVVHEEVEILNQQTVHGIGNISNVSDLVQFYESSHKVCQSECSVKNYAFGDKSPCKHSIDFEMSEKVAQKSLQQVHTLSNDAIEQNIRTCQNLSYADVKTDFIKIENEGYKAHLYGNKETSLHESKTDYDWSQIAETDFGHDNLGFKRDYFNTDNVVNEIDLRFIYSVY